MTDIDSANLRRLDMSQLLVFAELMRHRKLTVVAERLGLTQSAVSHILKRLRTTFNDELFLRRPAGVEPTARAVLLEPKVNAILRLSSEALTIERSFDARHADRTLRVGGLDHDVLVLGTPIVRLLRAEAPNMRLSFRTVVRKEALDALTEGTLDIAFGFFFSGVPDQFESIELFTETCKVVARIGHPALAGRKLSLETYCQAEHLLVSIGGDLRGIVDMTLERRGLTRRVAAAMPLFFPAMATVAETDLLATVPARLAARYAERMGLTIIDPPLEIRPFTVSALWHRRTASDLALRWFRSRLPDLVRS